MVHTKQRRGQRVPVSHEALALIRLQQAAAPKGCRVLFSGPMPGQPMADLSRFRQRVRIKAGNPDVHTDDLPHALAFLLVSGVASPERIGRLASKACMCGVGVATKV